MVLNNNDHVFCSPICSLGWAWWGQLMTCTLCVDGSSGGVGGSPSKILPSLLPVCWEAIAAWGRGAAVLSVDPLGFSVTEWLGSIRDRKQDLQVLESLSHNVTFRYILSIK